MVDAFDTRPAQLRPSPMLGKAMSSRGRAIVSDLQFWKSSQDWTAHEAKLRAHGVLMVEGINVFKKHEFYYFKSLKHYFIVDHDTIIFLFRIVGCVHGLGAICCI